MDAGRCFTQNWAVTHACIAALAATFALGSAPAARAADGLPAPTGLAASVSGKDVTLTWNLYPAADLPSNCTDNREIQIRRDDVQIATTGIAATSHVDPGLADDTYVYAIRARCRIPAVPGPGGSPAQNLVSDDSEHVTVTVEETVAVPTCSDAPSIVAGGSPGVLWPPNGKQVPVTVAGIVTPGDGCPMPEQVDYEVIDEYGEHSHVDSVGIVDGAFSFIIGLEASRRGDDRDGRRYTIVLTASADGFESEPALGEVVVPHDQRRR
jgi:hypothetical protein